MIHNTSSDLNLVIEDKLQLLRDFRLLGRRTKTVREILARCKTEREMERKLYDVLHGNITIDEWIQKEGY